MFVGVGVGIGRQRVSGGDVVFDADYQAVLNYATSLGYTLPSAGQQVKQNQLVLDLKSGGIWSKLDTFGVFATDGSASFALICWKRRVLMTAVNSPSFTTNLGYVGNGTSAYIDLNYNASTFGGNYTLNNACYGSGGNLALNSPSNGTNQSRGNLRGNTSNFNGINSTNSASPLFGYTTMTDIRYHDRDSSLSYRRLQGSTVIDTVAQTSTALPTAMYVLRDQFNYCLNTDRVSYVFAGASLYNQRVAFNSAISTYLASL